MQTHNLWSTGDSTLSIFIIPQEPVNKYTVTGTDHNGCKNSDEQIINVDDCSTFFIPNAFTPNNDGENDYFMPMGDFEGIAEFKMDIYNRWGELVYTTKNIYDKGWDGRYKNQNLQEGVYTFYMMYRTVWNKTFEKYGTIVLLR